LGISHPCPARYSGYEEDKPKPKPKKKAPGDDRDDVELETWEPDDDEGDGDGAELTFGDYSAAGAPGAARRRADPTRFDQHVHVHFLGVELFNVDAGHPFVKRMDKLERDREAARARAERVKRRLRRRSTAAEDGVPVESSSSDDDDDGAGDANVHFGDYGGARGDAADGRRGRRGKKGGLKCTQYEEKMIVKRAAARALAGGPGGGRPAGAPRAPRGPARRRRAATPIPAQAPRPARLGGPRGPPRARGAEERPRSPRR